MRLFTRTILFIVLCLQLLTSASWAATPTLIPYQVGGKWGYCNSQREVVIRASFDLALPFASGIGVVQNGNSMGAIRADGSTIVPAAFEVVVPGELLRLRRRGAWGLANLDGQVLTAFEFDEILPRIGGLFEVRKGEFSGMYDGGGKRVVPLEYTDLRCLRDAKGQNAWLIQVRQDDKLGIYNYCGQQVLPPLYDEIGAFVGGYATTRIGAKYGMISQEGREIVACTYDRIYEMREGRAAAMVKGHWGFLDASGKEAVPFKFEAVHEGGFFQGTVPVLQQGIWKIVDHAGHEVATLGSTYNFIGSFAEGLVPASTLVGKEVVYGYVTPEGQAAIAFQYDLALPFVEGLAIVGMRYGNANLRKEMRYGIINREGKLLLPMEVQMRSEAEVHLDSMRTWGWAWLENAKGRCRYDVNGHRRDCSDNGWEKLMFRFQQTRCENSARVAVAKNGLWGFANADGELVIPCKYRMAECFHNHLAKVWPSDGGNFFFIDGEGNEYVGG